MKKKSTIEAYKGMSFSDASLKIKSKYPQADVDLIQKNSLKVELEQLMQFQEKKKLVSQMQEAVKQFKKGGMLPKYSTGSLIGDPIKPYGVDDEDFGSLNLPNPTRLPSINPLDNPVIPQVDTLSPYNIPQLTFGEKVHKTVDGLVGDRNTPTTNTTNTGEMSAYTPALLGQGISTALNLGILAKGYDKVSPVENPYESQVKNLLASRGIDTTQQRNQILSAYQAAKNNINNARSANVRNALDTNLMNTTQDSLASSKLQEQQLNNAYVGEYANALNGLGQAKVAARTYAEDVNAKNKGQFLSNVSAFGASVADNSKFFTTSKLNTIQNKLLGDILSSKYADVGLNKEVVNRLSEGKLTPDDITILKKAYGEEAATQLIKKFGE